MALDALAEAEARIAATAPLSFEAAVDQTEALFTREPWRVDRVIPGASQMTGAEVGRVVERILAHCTDMNRTIALKALQRVAARDGYGPAVGAQL